MMMHKIEKYSITANSRVQLHRLFFTHYSSSSVDFNLSATVDIDPLEAYAVVRKSTDDTILLNKDGLEMVKLLALGKTVKYIATKEEYDTDQVIYVINQLVKNGFVKSINGKDIPDHKRKIHPWLTWLTRKYFKFFVCKFFLYLLWFFICTGLLIGLFTRSHWPNFGQYFWHPDPLIVVITLVLIGNFALILHEIGHFVVTKAFGGEAKISFDHRYLFLVAQTSSYYVNYLPFPQRFLLYLAGVLVDLTSISFGYWVLFIIDSLGLNINIEPFILALILIQIQGVLWQFNMHLETDIYNVFSDFIEFENLRATAKYHWIVRIIKLRIPIISRLFLHHYVNLVSENEHLTKEKLSGLTKYKRKLWLVYNILLFVGIIITTFQFLYLTLPREIQLVKMGLFILGKSLQNYDATLFIKAAALFILISYKYIILSWTLYRKKSRHRTYGYNPFEPI